MAYEPAALLIARLELKELQRKKQDATENKEPYFLPIKKEFLARCNKEIKARKNLIKNIELSLKN